MAREDESIELSRSIEEAMDAARAAGVGVGAGKAGEVNEDTVTPGALATLPGDRSHVSYSFLLDDLPDAPDVGDVETQIEAMCGVRCKIVHPRKKAWVTARETTPPEEIIEDFASLGITATLSDASMMRYLAALEGKDGQLRRTNRKELPGRMRRRRRSAARALDRQRRAGFGTRKQEPKPEVDVLYTARDLVTPARMWVALVLTLPVLALAYIPALQFDGWQWVSLLLSTPVVTWCAFPFHRALLGGVRRGIAALDGASSVAILIAYVWSAAVIFLAPTGHRGWHSSFSWFATTQGTAYGPELFLDVASGITLLLLIGRRYSIRARRLLIDEMTQRTLDPETEYPRIIKQRGCDGGQESIPVAEINRGDDIIVRLGEVIPVDGQVIGGRARLRPGLIDAHEPSEVKVGSTVYAGSVIGDGEIKVRTQRTGHATRWQAVHHWLNDVNQRERHATVGFARSAAMLLPVAMTVAFLSFILWGLITGDYNAALRTALAVLSGVAPVALALSPALALRLGVEAAARNGALLRDGSTLRTLEVVDTVVFNRVGTLAEPTMHIETVTAAEGESEEMLLRVAGALSMEAEHPVFQALVRGARDARAHSDDDLHLPVRYELVSVDYGRNGDVTGRIALTHVDEEGHENVHHIDAMLWRPINLSHLHGRLAVAATSGGTPVVVRWKGKDRGVITLFDPFKRDADEAVRLLESYGLETIMLTRDAYPVARRFADYLGISTVLAGITNARKPGAIRALQAVGAEVAMVGDNSVRDALRAANVSILHATADDIEPSRKPGGRLSVVLLRDDVMSVPQLIAHARTVCGIIDRNLLLAWAYNVGMLIFAAAGAIPPIVATVLMLGSSLAIEGLSMRARRFPQLNQR